MPLWGVGEGSRITREAEAIGGSRSSVDIDMAGVYRVRIMRIDGLMRGWVR